MRATNRRSLCGFALVTALLLPQPVLGAVFNVGGPPQNDVDGDAGSGVQVFLNSHVGGHISRDTSAVGLQVTVETDAVYADNLQLFISHNGIEVELYKGEGNDPIAQIVATFSTTGEEPAPTTGSVSGTVLPVGNLNQFRGQDLSGTWTLRIVDPMGNFDMTRLNSWTLTGNIEEGGPSRSVALFFNPVYVDTVDLPGDPFNTADAEALNIRELLTFLKHDVETFTGITAGDFATVLAGKDAVWFPSLEGPNIQGQALHPALDEAARDEIRNFVAAGGLFISNSTFFGHNGSLVSELFFGGKCTFIPQTPVIPPTPAGCVYSSNGSITGTLEDESVGTPFQGGSGSVSGNIISRGLQNLPVEAEVAYTGNLIGVTVPGNTVTTIPYPLDGSGGAIIWMANDFFNSVPEGPLDGGWPEIVDRALTDDLSAFLTAQQVALLNNAAYVDAVADAANLEASLLTLGHNVTTFTQIDVATINATLAGTDVLVLPDLEVDSNGTPGPDFVDDLSTASRDAIFNFVDAGGILITHSASAETFLEDFLALDPLYQNGDAVDLVASQGDVSLGSPVAGTVFQQPTLSLENNTTTDLFSGFPVPNQGGGRAFVVGVDRTAVGLFRVGAGQIIWMGWDWENGAQDNGWVDTLGRAVSAAGPLPIPEPGGALSVLAILAALAGLSRRNSKGV